MKAVFCDLGNVLLRFSHDQMIAQVARQFEVTADRMEELVFGSGRQVELETGAVTPRQLYDELCEKTANKPPFEQVCRAFSEIFEPIEPMFETIRAVRKKGHKTVLISNTNAMHWEFCDANYQISRLFDHLVLSHEVGAMKPDPKIFETALHKAQATPNEAVFLDDIKEYCAKAQSLGIESHCVKDPVEVRSWLKSFHLL